MTHRSPSDRRGLVVVRRPLLAASLAFCWSPVAAARDKPGDKLEGSGCYILRASSTDRYLSNQTGRLSNGVGNHYVDANHTEDDIKVGEKFCLVEVAPKRHLIVGEDNVFVTSVGGEGGSVQKAWSPGPASEWEFVPTSPSGIYGIRSAAHNRWLNADPNRVYHGVVKTQPALGNDERWSIFKADGCACSPELEPDIATDVQVQPTTGPIVGYADTHAHTFSNLGFGTYEMHGEAFDDRYGIRGALPWCSFSHGREGATDLIGLINHGRAHKESGFPQFDGWPVWNDLNHQHQYYKWIERAYRGGLRLQVMLAVNNELICGASKLTVAASAASMSIAALGLIPPTARDLTISCDDMSALDRQIDRAKAMERFIDAQSGGEGKGWYRIADSAADARKIMESGKMAVILGTEVDTLFGCSANTPCTTEQVDTELDRLYDKGVRYVFPVHILDNAFGGAAQYNWLFIAANVAKNEELFKVETCADPKVTKRMVWRDLLPTSQELVNNLCGLAPNLPDDLGIGLTTACQKTLPNWLVPPAGPGGHCNARGLTDLGAHLVNRLMDKGMIIDIDHMGSKTLEGVLAIAEARDYPLVAGHTPFRDQATNPDEVFKSPLTIQRIQRLGGILSPVLNSGASKDDTKDFGIKVANDCPGSSKGWAQNYLYLVDQLGGPEAAAVPFGSDMNGWLSQPSPRFGDDSCSKKGGESDPMPKVEYPFSAYLGGGTFGQLSRDPRTGDGFDYNTYGLANVGLLPDFVQDLENVGLTKEDLQPLFRSAEGVVKMWEKAEARKAQSPYTRVPLGGKVKSFDWAQASRYCESQNLRLATRAEICPNGISGAPMFGRLEGDVWMAVGDHSNAWLSIGTAHAGQRQCRLHEEAYGAPPPWGKAKGPEPVTETPAAARCVGNTRVPIGSGLETIYSFNWSEAKSYCEQQGMRLATRGEICPSGASGEPIYGSPEGDVWMAVGDRENSWISIGTSYPERRCKLHEEALQDQPAWGLEKGPQAVAGEPAAVVCKALK